MSTPASQAKSSADTQQLISNISNTYSAIERGDWVNAGLGMANTAMGMVGMSANPLSGFLSAGFSWAIQHVDFLREPFDVLLGSPESISKMAQTYRSAGQQVQGIATEYERICVSQTREWQGRAADAYRAAAKKHADGMESLSKATHGIASAVEGAGKLVAEVRKQIMDMISQAVADMVMKIIQWLAASVLTFGAAIAGAIADIVSTAVRYAKKLADFLQKLLGSVKKLIDLVKQVSQIAKVAEQIIDAISSMAHKGAGGGGGGVYRPTSGGFGGLGSAEQNQAHAGAGGTFTSGVSGPGVSHGSGPGGGHVAPVYTPPGAGTPGGYPVGGGAGGGAGGHVAPIYTPPGSPGGGSGGRPPGGGSGGHVSPGYTPPGSGSGSGSGSGTGTGPGRWVPGHWEPADTTTAAGGGAGGGGGVSKPPSFGSTPTTTNADWYRPTTTDHSATAASSGGGGGGGGGGGIPKGMGGGGGGMPPGFGGGPAGGGGAGGTAATQFGGAAGVMAAGGAGGGAAAAAGGAPHGPGGGGAGGGAGGMMGGAPMAGAGGQQGGSGEHKRKVRIEGEALVEPPKAAKPVIGE